MADDTTPQQIARLEANLKRLGQVVVSVRGDANLNDPEIARRLGAMFELATGILERNTDGFAQSLADDLATLKVQLLDVLEEFDPASDEPMYAIQRAQGALGVLMVPVDRALMSAQALGMRPAMPVGHVPDSAGIPAAALDRRSVGALLGRLDRIGKQLEDLRVEAEPERAPSPQQRLLVSHFVSEMKSQLGLMRAELTLKRSVDFNAISRAVDTTVELTKDLVASARGMVRSVTDTVREKALAVRGETRRLVRGVRTFVTRTVKRVMPDQETPTGRQEPPHGRTDATQPPTRVTSDAGSRSQADTNEWSPDASGILGGQLRGHRIRLVFAEGEKALREEAVQLLTLAGADASWVHHAAHTQLPKPEYLISTVDMLVVIWTERARASEAVLQEADIAAQAGILLPFRFPSTPPYDLPSRFLDIETEVWSTSSSIIEAIKRRARKSNQPAWLRAVAEAHHAQGIRLERHQMLDEAAGEFRLAIDTWGQLGPLEPGGPWQDGMANSLLRYGDVSFARGELDAALRAFRKALDMREELTKHEPDDGNLLRDIVVCHTRIGDVLYSQGKLDDALAAFRSQLAMAEAIAGDDLQNTSAQRLVAVAWNKIGDVRLAMGHPIAALEAYSADLAIAERLAAAEPRNPGLQSGLALTLERIGDTHASKREYSSALDFYRRSLAIREALTARNQHHVASHSDLITILDRIGDMLIGLNHREEAIEIFNRCLANARALAAKVPNSAMITRTMASVYSKCGTTYESLNRLHDAMLAFQGQLAIYESLEQAHPADRGIMTKLATAWYQIGEIAFKLGDTQTAVDAFARSTDVSRRVLALAPDDVPANIELVAALWQTAELKGSRGRPELEEALDLMKSLAAAGKLQEKHLNWIPHLQAHVANLQF